GRGSGARLLPHVATILAPGQDACAPQIEQSYGSPRRPFTSHPCLSFPEREENGIVTWPPISRPTHLLPIFRRHPPTKVTTKAATKREQEQNDAEQIRSKTQSQRVAARICQGSPAFHPVEPLGGGDVFVGD